MAEGTGSNVASLTARLMAASNDLEDRIRIKEQGPAALSTGPDLIAGCTGWPGVLEVIRRTVEEKRPTLVYGDYDVDGVISTYLLFRWLRSRSVPGNCFIPTRTHHGYGLDAGVVETAVQQGYKTIIALDCGTANLVEVSQAREAGLDVVIIDHHETKDALPDAPLLNHHLEPSLEEFCTAGLVFYVVQLLRRELGGEPAPDELELAGLATIADIVPLTTGNWALAHLGLAALPETLNLGLQELIKISKLHGLTRLTGRQAGFSLIPRMNAAGRMRSAEIVLRLLQSPDGKTAREVARALENLNAERKRLSDQTARSALLQATSFEDSAALALYDSQWHPGILGIVAARVAEVVNKPTAILCDAPREEGLLTGSVRTAGDCDVVGMLGECTGTLVSFGGHSAAAGLKLELARLVDFRGEWSQSVKKQDRKDNTRFNEYHNLPRVEIRELTQQFEDDIWGLEPFGNGFPAPRCVLDGCRVDRVAYMGKDKTHLNLTVTDGQRSVRIAGFNMSHLYHRLRAGDPVRPVVEIEPDNWNNRYSIMLRLLGVMEDYGPQGFVQ